MRLVTQRDAVRATAAVFAGISIALVLGVPIATFLGTLLGWRWAFACLSLLCATTAQRTSFYKTASARGLATTRTQQ